MTPLGSKVTLARDNLLAEEAMYHIAKSRQSIFTDQRSN